MCENCMSSSEVAQAARNAAALLREHGWTHHVAVSRAGQYCMMTAVHRAVPYNYQADVVFHAVWKLICELFPADYLAIQTVLRSWNAEISAEERIVFWNDNYGTEETATLILDKLGTELCFV